jgi:hypothetical protein
VTKRSLRNGLIFSKISRGKAVEPAPELHVRRSSLVSREERPEPRAASSTKRPEKSGSMSRSGESISPPWR